MPAQFASLAALQEALKLSSGELWISLLTISHETLATPLRLASPVLQNFMSQGRNFSPTRFDVTVSSDTYDAPVRAQVVIDAVDGTLLQALQALTPSPTVDIEIVTESEPDLIQVAQRGLEFSRLSTDGVRMSFDLSTESVLSAPFPGLRMTRDRVPGIFTDL